MGPDQLHYRGKGTADNARNSDVLPKRSEKVPDKTRRLVFVGFSAEGLQVAEAVQANLDRSCETEIWSQGTFGLSEGTLESLVKRWSKYDFAILVLTPDDFITSRDEGRYAPRDNVLLELRSVHRCSRYQSHLHGSSNCACET